MDIETPLKCGYLFVPPQTFLRKSWLKRYCVLYESSQQGIQRLELFETDDAFVKQCPSKIIPLNDCWKVAPFPQKQQANVFEVRKKEESHQFSSDTFQDMTEWLTSLQSVAFGKTTSTSSSNSTTVSEKQEENFLYSSITKPEIHKVKIIPTEASLRNNLAGHYELLITPVNIAIAKESGKVILSWPYRHIRRYGCNTENFSFEAGRKCPSGEGIFIFETNIGAQIFATVDSNVSSFQLTQAEREEDFSHFTSRRKRHSNENRTSLPAVSSIETYNTKPIPPIKKPPRKSKLDSSPTETGTPYPHFKEATETLNKHLKDDITRNVYPKSRYANEMLDEIKETRNWISEGTSPKPERNILNSENVPKKINLSYNVNYLESCDTFRDFDETEEPVFYQRNSMREPSTLTQTRRQSLEIKNSSDSYFPAKEHFYLSSEYLPNSIREKLRLSELEPTHYLKNEAEYAQITKKN